MGLDFTKPRSSDAKASQERIDKKDTPPKKKFKDLSRKERFRILYGDIVTGDPVHSEESREHQKLEKTVEKLLDSLQKDHKIASAFYDTNKDKPYNPAMDEYDFYAQGYNTRQEKLATINTKIQEYNATRLGETPIQELDLPPKLKLITTTSPDSGSSSPNNPDLHRNVNAADQNSDSAGSDRLKETEVPSSTEQQQEKSSYNYWTLKRLSRLISSLITGITLPYMYKTMDVAARAIPTDLSNNVDPFKDALVQESHSILAKMKRQYDPYGNYTGPTPFLTAKVVGPIVGVGVPLTAAIIYCVYRWGKQSREAQRAGQQNPGGAPQNPGGAPQNPGGAPQNPGGAPQNPGGAPQNPGAYNLGAYPGAAPYNPGVPAPAAQYNIPRRPVTAAVAAAQFNIARVPAAPIDQNAHAPLDPNAPAPPPYQA